MLHERFVTILIDEMKIQEDLIWVKYTGELIGFVDLGDGDVNAATLDKHNELATHVLVFLVKSIVNPLSISLATFATTAVSSFQLMPIFWTAIRYLEKINLKVISATADGASPNRKFLRIHKFMDGDAGKRLFTEHKIFTPRRNVISSSSLMCRILSKHHVTALPTLVPDELLVSCGTIVYISSGVTFHSCIMMIWIVV